MLDVFTLLFRFTMRTRMLFNPIVAVVRMSISQERPASPQRICSAMAAIAKCRGYHVFGESLASAPRWET
jgi:hypothetical protein